MMVSIQTKLKILSFRKLEKGWNHGEGIPFKEEIIQKALGLERKAFIYGFNETDARVTHEKSTDRNNCT